MALTEQIADTTRRVSYVDSYALPQVSRSYNYPVPQAGSFSGSYSVFVGPGVIQLSGSRIIGDVAPGSFNGYWYPGGNNNVIQGYIEATNGSLQMRGVASAPASLNAFPAGSLPLFAATFDTAGRIATLADWRPRGAFGLTELISGDTTLRRNWIKSFDLPQVTKIYPTPLPDIYGGNLVFVGPGSVQVGAGPIVAWNGGYVKTSTITNGQPGYTQGYCDPVTGVLSTAFVTSSTAAFPAGSLAIFLATVDATGRIVGLTDMRPA